MHPFRTEDGDDEMFDVKMELHHESESCPLLLTTMMKAVAGNAGGTLL